MRGLNFGVRFLAKYSQSQGAQVLQAFLQGQSDNNNEEKHYPMTWSGPSNKMILTKTLKQGVNKATNTI